MQTTRQQYARHANDLQQHTTDMLTTCQVLTRRQHQATGSILEPVAASLEQELIRPKCHSKQPLIETTTFRKTYKICLQSSHIISLGRFSHKSI